MQAELTRLEIAERDIYATFRAYADNETWEYLSKFKDVAGIEVKLSKGKRSNNANAYFHVLCQEISTAMNLRHVIKTPIAVKNALIADYGQVEYTGDYPIKLKTKMPPEEALNRPELHLMYIGVEPNDWYCYYVMRGSHTYNTAEMTALINGAVALAKDYGVVTMPPKEMERLLAIWTPKEKA